MKTLRGFFLGLLVVLAMGAISVIYLAPRVYWTLADMDATAPSKNSPIAIVVCRTNVFDWGGPKLFCYEPTNTAPVTEARRAAGGGAPGRMVHDWVDDVRFFGAIPYHPKYTLMPWGWNGTANAISSSDFTVWIRAELPATYTTVQGMFEISPAVTTSNAPAKTLSAFGMRASPTAWGFVFRSITGASGAGSTTNDAAVMESSPAALAAYAGQLVDIIVTRAGTNGVVYFNGADVTSLFTFSNPAGWAKPLAGGSNLFFQVGNNVNPWYWSKPIHRFCFWSSALNSSQAANPNAVGSKIVDFTPDSVVEPTDLTAAFNAASYHNQTRGGGAIRMPSGVYRVGGTVNIGKMTTWKGDGSAVYVSTTSQAHRPAGTTIFQWVNATNVTFLADKTQGEGVFLAPTSVSGGGIVSSTWLRSELADFAIAGTFGSADAINFDRVGSINVHNVHFYNVPGYDIRVFAGNAVYIVNCTSANSGRSLLIQATADYKVLGCFFDSGRGPIMRLIGNLGEVADCTLEISQNPRITVPAYEMLTTVNITNDEFTVSSQFGHLLNSGTLVRFDADSTNVLPGPLNEDTDYYAIPTSTTTFKVSTVLVDESTLSGALYRSSALDITNSGSGVWYSGVGPSANIHLSGDHNSIIGNHGQQGWEHGIILDGTYNVTKNNTLIGNHWLLTAPNNTNSFVCSMKLINAHQNVLMGNQLDDRDLNTTYTQNGVIVDSLSASNIFLGNSFNVDYPYNDETYKRNTVIDGNSAFFRTARLLVNRGTSTNIFYAILANTQSGIQWDAPNGTLTATNAGTAARFTEFVGPYVSGAVYGQVNSLNSSESFEFTAMRNWTNSNTGFQPTPAYAKLGGYRAGGWRGNNGVDSSIAGEIAWWTGSTAWNLTNAHSQAHISIIPPTSAARKDALILHFPTTGNSNSTPLIIARHDNTNWVDAASGWQVTLSTNNAYTNASGVGFRYLLVPNSPP